MNITFNFAIPGDGGRVIQVTWPKHGSSGFTQCTTASKHSSSPHPPLSTRHVGLQNGCPVDKTTRHSCPSSHSTSEHSETEQA